MRKYIICLVLFLCFTSIVFAQFQEKKYVVTITYAGSDGKILTEKINVLSTSASEAENKATRQWEALKQTDWEFKFANAIFADDEIANSSVANSSIENSSIENSSVENSSVADSSVNAEPPKPEIPKEIRYRVVITFWHENAPPVGRIRNSMSYTVSALSPQEAKQKAEAEWYKNRLPWWSGIISINEPEKID